MPVLQPAELWKRSGRYDIDEVFKLEDRRGAELVLAMTHEENLTFHIARDVRSYRELPMLLYHFQTKERDEPRPRAGVLRTREFIMKDAYTFDRDAEGLDALVRAARRGLRPHLRSLRAGVVPGRVGRGDDGRHRRPRVHGAVRGGRERGGALRQPATRPTWRWRAPRPQPVEGLPERPGRARARGHARAPPRSIRCAASSGVPAGRADQGVPGGGGGARTRCWWWSAATTALNEIKLQNALGAPFARGPAGGGGEPVRRAAPGFIGPVGATCRGAGRRGAARPGRASWPAPTSPTRHLRGVEPGRDFEPTLGRRARASRPATLAPAAARSASSRPSRSATSSSSARASREPLGATLPGRGRQRAADLDGLLRHRPGAHRRRRDRAVRRRARDLVAARDGAVRRGARDAGQGGRGGAHASPTASTRSCATPGSTCSTTTATSSAGEKFADAELLGCPLRLTVGQARRGVGRAGGAGAGAGGRSAAFPLEGAAAAVAELWRELP